MRPLFTQLLNAPSRLAATAMSSIARRQPAAIRSGVADPFDRLPAMVAAERRREALRRMRAAT